MAPFTALKGNAEVQRRAFVKAVSPPGSKDVVILVAGSTTASRWRKENGEKTPRAVVDSLRVSSSKTNLKKDEERPTTGRTSRRCPTYHRRRRAAGRVS